MNAILHQYRAWLAPLLTLLAALLVLAAILIPLNAKRENYLEIIQKSQPRIERVQGLIQAAPQLELQLDNARASARQQIYPLGVDDNRFNTELQTRLRALAEQSKMTLASIRPLPSRKEHELDIFLLNMNLQGNVNDLQRFLSVLQRHTESTPALRIDALTLRRANIAPDAPQILSVDLTIAALRPASSP